ncbi:hypothetical protein IMY05_019G0124400 [Salix suchowensis]|nr:hypothetical protein IMY05_019G0124400 [Salix suchowensis]
MWEICNGGLSSIKAERRRIWHGSTARPITNMGPESGSRAETVSDRERQHKREQQMKDTTHKVQNLKRTHKGICQEKVVFTLFSRIVV